MNTHPLSAAREDTHDLEWGCECGCINPPETDTCEQCGASIDGVLEDEEE